MKRILIALISLFALLPAAALGQVVTMDEGHVAFDYPDSWLVVSPQLCGVYAPLLEVEGMDADALSAELTQTRTLSRAYSADFEQNMSVIIREDDISASSDTPDRCRIRSSADRLPPPPTSGIRSLSAP